MTTPKREIPLQPKSSGTGPAQKGRSRTGDDASVRLDTGGSDVAGVGVAGSAVADEAGAAFGGQEALARERDEMVDSLLRLRAEFDNYRKRAARELTDARVCAQGDLLVDLLPVLDNLERALDAAEHHEEGKVLQGVRLTRDLFVGLLTQAGVEEVPGVGSGFDPEVHEAVSVQPSELDEGQVTTVLERGYRQGAQVLRPARVVVSAGPGGAPAGG